tara:strand:+ start:11 stop:271 length:261 start_codon:yes stop_codon:yes gene_type:complete
LNPGQADELVGRPMTPTLICGLKMVCKRVGGMLVVGKVVGVGIGQAQYHISKHLVWDYTMLMNMWLLGLILSDWYCAICMLLVVDA